MRTKLFGLAVAAALAGWSVAAQTPAASDARDQFQTELGKQCPSKQLQMLSTRDLRDGLDDYQEGLPQELRDRLQTAETSQCSTMQSGAECVNDADLITIVQVGRIGELAGSVCESFIRCTDEGVCDYAR
ncbi:MAG TPA: hypothetical protein VGL58_14575 [Caulobacteraceae bacterium]|jgi:hypothetical protein